MINKGSKASESELVSGALALTVSVFAVKAIGYLYKLPLSFILGDEGMGYFNSAYSVFSFFYMLSLGGVPRAVAVCTADSRYRYGMQAAQKILDVSLKIFLAIGMSFALLLMLFSDFFAEAIGNSSARFSLLCIAPSLSFVAAAGVLRGYLNGVGKLKCVAVAEVLDGVSKFVTGLMLAAFASHRGENAYIVSAYTILGVSIGAFIGALFMYICSKTVKREEKTKQKCECGESGSAILRKIFKIAAPLTLSSAIIGATNIIDLGMIMKRLVSIGFSEVEAVSLYGNFTTLVIPLLNLASAFVSPFATAAMPHITKHRTLGNSDEYYRLIEQIIFLTSFFISPIAIIYLLFSDDVLLILFKDSSAVIAAPMLSMASASVLFSAILIMTNTILESSGHFRVPLFSMGAGAGAKTLSAYILIGRIGIYGAPISTVICYFTAAVISIFMLRKKVKLKRSVVRILLPPFLIALLVLLPSRYLYAFIRRIYPESWIVVPFMALASIVYIAITWIIMRNKAYFSADYVKIAKKC